MNESATRRIRGLRRFGVRSLFIALIGVAMAAGWLSPPRTNPVKATAARSTTTMSLAMFGAPRMSSATRDIEDALDPARVMSPDACAKCHVQEAVVWNQTPHAQTFETLHRHPEAKAIAARLGIRSIKRGGVCADCHYTRVESNGRDRAIAGVSCESCHGAGQDWIDVHNDFGGSGISRDAETPAHREQRLRRSEELGMRNPRNVYRIARSCLNCHTVPNEELVNVGGHHAGSADFELVAWSQGRIRHRFISASGRFNAPASIESLRVMYVAGLIADLEFSTRATASATRVDRYGRESAMRAADVAVRLQAIQDQVHDPHLEVALRAFSEGELRTNNSLQLTEIADRIRDAGIEFGETADGSSLGPIDPLLPSANEYR